MENAQQNAPDSTGKTIAEKCGNDAAAIEAMRKRWSRYIGTAFDRNRVPTDAEMSLLYPAGNTRTKKPPKENKAVILPDAKTEPETPQAEILPQLETSPQPEKPKGITPETKAEKPTQQETETVKVDYKAIALLWLFDIVAILVVVGHALLIWYDAFALWGDAGKIGGGCAFLVVLLALIIAVDESKQRTSEAAMWFILLVDIGAWFVHKPAFMQFAKVDATMTGWFCAAICSFSFMALYLFRDSKLP